MACHLNGYVEVQLQRDHSEYRSDLLHARKPTTIRYQILFSKKGVMALITRT